MKTIKIDSLEINVFDTRKEMGAKAAEDAAEYINDLMKQKKEINIVFAAAPSQNDFLNSLSKCNIDWKRINAFHMDEYIGLTKDAPQRFGNYLLEHIFSLVPFKSVHYIFDAGKTPEEICTNYTKLLKDYPTDIIFMGVGENGHIAFNDPHVAFFNDPKDVKVVELDEVCRTQQVHDGCFASLDFVPKKAITLTISNMMRAKRIFCIAPTKAKANAINNLVHGPICQKCPASILRTHKASTLYLDTASAQFIL